MLSPYILFRNTSGREVAGIISDLRILTMRMHFLARKLQRGYL